MKKKQSYSSHIRYYVPHHFIFYPVMLVLLVTSFSRIFTRHEHREEWIFITILAFTITWLSYMLRQHYALTNQNRIVRLELRLRYYQLTKQDFEPVERQLNFGQLAALRFASNEEILELIERTINENLEPKAIKKSIINWQPDHMRV